MVLQRQTGQTREGLLRRLAWLTIGFVGLVVGSAIVFLAKKPGDIRSDGARRLTAPKGKESNQNPCFAPDGTKLFFTRWLGGYNQGPAQLVLLDLATGYEQVLLSDTDSANVNVPFGCWSGATDRIVFSSDRASELDEIWTMRSDGSDLRRVTTHTELRAYIEPVFSPDGTQIVFESDALSDDEDGSFGQIMLINADGTDLRALTDRPADETIDDRLPSWSAGGQILFQRRFKVEDSWTKWDIFVTEPDGQGGWAPPRNVNLDDEITSRSDETDNSWSPDGRWIISSSDHGGLAHPNIFAFPASGGEPDRFTFASNREDGAPSMSPDKHWIAFESHRRSDEESPTDIWIIGVNYFDDQLHISQ